MSLCFPFGEPGRTRNADDMGMPSATKCESCGKNPATEEHTCPFSEEIHDDGRLCTCCDDCAHQCAMDI